MGREGNTGCVCVCVFAFPACDAASEWVWTNISIWQVYCRSHRQLDKSVLWDVSWRIDPGFSVRTNSSACIDKPTWQPLWLTDSWRTSCSRSPLRANRLLVAVRTFQMLRLERAAAIKQQSAAHAVRTAAGGSHPVAFNCHCVRVIFSFALFELFLWFS